MAWVFDRYVRDAGLYHLQDEAKLSRKGLWSDKDPVPPWAWRQARRDANKQGNTAGRVRARYLAET